MFQLHDGTVDRFSNRGVNIKINDFTPDNNLSRSSNIKGFLAPLTLNFWNINLLGCLRYTNVDCFEMNLIIDFQIP